MKNCYVSYNGQLKVKGINLLNQYDELFVLKGISTHGIQWYSKFANKSMLKSLKDNLYINAIRIAMYTEEDGYIYHKKLKNKVKEIVNFCTELDLYVIIDWHILRDGNPNIHINEALDFFDEMSKEYKKSINVIYEICNEPNGDTTWVRDIKPYAEKIIKVIRNNNPHAIIIVGSEKYSTSVDITADNPIDEDNILYSLHFYSGSHKDELREKIIYALSKELPIIVSEFGVSDASGDGDLSLDEGKIWLDFLRRNYISFFNWSLSDKNESSALLKPNSNVFEIKVESLSESGKFIKEQYKK